MPSDGLFWEARHPGVPQLCAKRDVNRAFKWHTVCPDDVEDFGTRIQPLMKCRQHIKGLA